MTRQKNAAELKKDAFTSESVYIPDFLRPMEWKVNDIREVPTKSLVARVRRGNRQRFQPIAETPHYRFACALNHRGDPQVAATDSGYADYVRRFPRHEGVERFLALH